MGNYRFKLSDMLPNSWLNKLKKKQPSKTENSPRADAPADPPRRSCKQKPRRRPSTRPARPSQSPPSNNSVGRESHHLDCRSDPHLLAQSFADTNVTVTENEHKTLKSPAVFELPAIITRPSPSLSPPRVVARNEKPPAKEQRNSPSKKFTVNSPAKLRMNSPRVSSKRFNQVVRRKSVSSSSKRRVTESLAIVKSSDDPQRDFRESMVEMIIENRISDSSELEDLLACYLSLNTDEYHEVIIEVFKQIWFDMTHIGI